MKEISKKNRIRNDIVLIVSVLIIAIMGILYLFVFRDVGNSVTVTVDGKEYGVYSLFQDRCEDIYTGENGINYNRLIIQDGKAYIETASCPDGICVSHKPVFRDGESIICIPNRVVVTVKGEKNPDSPDIIA